MSKLFDKLVSLYRMVNPDHDAVADVYIGDAPTLALLSNLLQRDPDDTGLAVLSGDPSDLAQGQTIRLQFNAPRRGVGLLLHDVAQLVEAGQLREPSRYFLLNPLRAKDDPEPPEIIGRYRAALEFIDLLKRAAAYLDESQGELVFVQNGRFIVPIRYTVADLADRLPSVIDRLAALFNEDMHRDQKFAMLASAVQEAAGRVEPQARFTELLSHLDDVTRTVTESYRLFCSNFSYEKVKNDIQDAHIEFTTKIHKTFSDIQSQLLAIPVATVIVTTQMKRAEGLNSQFWINTGVLLGSAIFVVLFWLLVINQRHTLAVLEEEIGRREAAIAKDHERIMDLFETTFRYLRNRITSQKRIIAIVQAIVVLGFVATVVVYVYLLYLPVS
ncbi:hypothetical protein ACW7G0_07575 [Lysobacter sp. A286]